MCNQAGKTIVHAFLLIIAKMAKLYQYCTPSEEALIVKLNRIGLLLGILPLTSIEKALIIETSNY